MGAVTFSIDPRLVTTLKTHLALNNFVETGTFEGDTIETVKNTFKHIYTVELSTKYYEDCKKRFKKLTNLTLLQGDSVAALANIVPKVQNDSTLYWLDAHWCVATNTEGKLSQCPLLGELAAIQHLNKDSVIVIDDARLFLSSPPAPHEITDWPTIDAIIKKLHALSSVHEVCILNDCIIYYPASLAPIMSQYAHLNGIDWLHALDKSRDYDKILTQCIEKEEQIQLLAKLCKDREEIINQLKNNPTGKKKKKFFFI